MEVRECAGETRMTRPLLIATTAVAILLALPLAGVGFAQSAQVASFDSYMPELQLSMLQLV